MLSGHWGTIFDNTSPFGAIRSLRYNIWSYLSIWYYQVTEVQYLIPPPFGTIRSLRYNIWQYLSIWYYQVTEVQYLIIPLHLVLSGHWGTIFINIWSYWGTIFLHLVLSGHWGTIFDHTSPFGAIRSLRYNIWSYLSIWCYQVTEVQYLIIPYPSIWYYQVTEVQYLMRYNIWPLHLVLSGHWGTIFDNTSPFVAIRSLRYNIWSYPSIWYYQVTEVQYLILTLHLVLSGHWGTIFDHTSPLSGGTIFDHTSPFGTIRSPIFDHTSPFDIRSLRNNIWLHTYLHLIIPFHLVLSGHWGTIFDHTSPFGAIRSLRYNIWSYLSIWCYQVTEVQYLILTLHLVLSGHWGTIFDNTSPFVAIRSLRYNIWSYPSIWYYQVTEVQYLIHLLL